MPFMGQDAQSQRKRRRHDDDCEGPIFAVLQPSGYLNSSGGTRKILPLSKRTKFGVDDGTILHADFSPSHRRRSSQHRTPHNVVDVYTKSNYLTMSMNLSPCYICHRRPTKKSDLGSFAECQGCNQRTCFVCIRQCYGRNTSDEDISIISEQKELSRSFQMEDTDGDSNSDRHVSDKGDDKLLTFPSTDMTTWNAGDHQSFVCSRCCVERGVEGEVFCLGCLPNTERS